MSSGPSSAAKAAPRLRRPDERQVWVECHAALMDQLLRHEPVHALRRLARAAADLLGVPVALHSQVPGRADWVIQGGGDWPSTGPATPWVLPLLHLGQPVGELRVAALRPPDADDRWRPLLQALLDTAAALVAESQVERGEAGPASLALARAAMREAGTFVWEWDIATDVLGDIDEGALMLGYGPHQIGHTQDDWNRLIHPDDAEVVEAAYQAHVRGETDLYRAVYRARAADGSWRWIEERGRVVVRDAQGQPLRMFGTQTDATVQHALEQARRDHLAAEAASAAKTQFLSRVSHELRTPLNAVMGFAQLLDLDTASALNDTQRRRVTLIRQAGDYLLSMIGDLLDLSLVESGRLPVQIETLPLAPLLQDCVDLMHLEADAARIRVVLSPAADGLQVRADPMRLKQVLINLLSNAIKYNRPGGEVSLAVGPTTPSGPVVVWVSDTGLGIPPDHRAGLFQPFNRLGRESSGIPGSGLGLALSQALVQVMGGQLSLAHSAPQGSCFELRLPRA